MKLNKIVSAVLGAASIFAVGAANAATFPDFGVTPGAYGSGLYAPFTADKITGNYVEVVTFTGANTFDVSLRWNAGQFVADDGVTALSGATTGLGSLFGYGLYAFFQGTGTFASAGGVTTFTLTGGSLSVFLDDDQDTDFVQPATGTGAWTTADDADDVLLATGLAISGEGNLDPSLPTCDPGINCGSFGQSTSFNLTAAGAGFFTSPVPFYNVSFESGQLNNFDVSGTQVINGSMDTVFTAVPEPGTLALAGIALLGIGAVRRRKA